MLSTLLQLVNLVQLLVKILQLCWCPIHYHLVMTGTCIWKSFIIVMEKTININLNILNLTYFGDCRTVWKFCFKKSMEAVCSSVASILTGSTHLTDGSVSWSTWHSINKSKMVLALYIQPSKPQIKTKKHIINNECFVNIPLIFLWIPNIHVEYFLLLMQRLLNSRFWLST